MEGLKEFEAKLNQAVREKRQELDLTILPQLKRDLQTMLSYCSAISIALVRKSIFHDSSMHYEAAIEGIVPPSLEFIPEGRGKQYTIASRFGQYMSMLSYAVQRYQFSCVFLTPKRISKLEELLRSFDWDALDTISANANTRVFAEIVNDFKRTGDSFSLGVVSGNLSQLSALLPSVLDTLKILSDFQRESYKLEVRTSAIPRAGIPESGASDKAIIEAIKRVFPNTMHGAPFYTDLIKEIIAENTGANATELRKKALLAVRTEAEKLQKDKKEDIEEDYRIIVVTGIKILGSTSQQLLLIINKLSENLKVFQAANVSLFSTLMELFRKAFNLPAKEVEIAVTLVDPVSQAQTKEVIAFNKFMDMLKRKAQLLSGFDTRGSSVWKKLDAMPDQQLFSLLSSTISEMNGIVRQCDGIDEFFKAAAKGPAKSRIRGIKIEISAVKNAIAKANRIRANYAARVEERDQLKKLGII